MTDDGKPPNGVVAGGFTAVLNGDPVRVTSVARYKGPRRVVIVLDTSRSMTDKIHYELALARSLIASAPPEDAFAILSFSRAIQQQVGFQQGREAVLMRIDSLSQTNWTRDKSRGETVLLDALMAALDMLRPARIGDAIYVISDGEDNASRTSQTEVTKRMESEQVRCFWAATIESKMTTTILSPSVSNGPDLLRTLAKQSGGAYVEIYSAASLAAARPLAWAIENFFEVQLALPAAVHKMARLRIQALDSSGTQLEHIELAYPQHLAPCKADGTN